MFGKEIDLCRQGFKTLGYSKNCKSTQVDWKRAVACFQPVSTGFGVSEPGVLNPRRYQNRKMSIQRIKHVLSSDTSGEEGERMPCCFPSRPLAWAEERTCFIRCIDILRFWYRRGFKTPGYETPKTR